MGRRLHLESVVFLECLGEAVADGLKWLARPTVSGLSYSYDDEPLGRKLRAMAARGVIALPDPTDARILRLTERGHAIVNNGVCPPEQWGRNWDGLWRMILFDIAEVDRPVRTRLRKVLTTARMGYLQGSAWISPDPLGGLRDEVRAITPDPESLLFFEGKPFAGESDASLVNGAWSLRRLRKAHEYCLGLLRRPPGVAASGAAWMAWLAEERTAWEEALALDPLLPDALLPADYLGKEVHALRREVLRRALPRLLTEEK